MTNNEIVIKYYDFINGLFKKWRVNEDCQQMIWEDLLNYDPSKLSVLDAKNELRYWLVRFIKNYWFSKTSRYYYTYIKPVKVFDELSTYETDEDSESEY